MTVPHFSFPLKFQETEGRFAVHEQDSDTEIIDCARVLLLTTLGERETNPEFGIPDMLFKTEIDLEEIEARLEQWDNRVDAGVAEVAVGDDLVHHYRVNIQ